MSDELMVLSHPARVLRSEEAFDSLLSLAKQRGFVEEADADNLYFFRAEISNDQLDSHFTHMDESTLLNYASDANRGVAFLRGHNWHELPIGYSISAHLDESDSRKRVIADFYTIKGLQDTNDLIARMQARLVRDVSVGFHGGSAICDICTKDLWGCRHFPGLKYEEKQGDTVRKVLATFTISGANLSEVSAVFDGSTPDAMVLKAQRAARSGELSSDQIEILENRYRTRLPTQKSFALGLSKFEEGENPGKVEMMDEIQTQRLVSVLASYNILPEDKRTSTDANVLIEAIETAGKRLKEIEPLAQDGQTYRNDLITEALAEGVRAHGNDFDKSIYEGTLRNASLTTIKRMRDDWKKVANSILPAGRATVDNDQTPPKDEVKVTKRVPDAAYAV